MPRRRMRGAVGCLSVDRLTVRLDRTAESRPLEAGLPSGRTFPAGKSPELYPFHNSVSTVNPVDGSEISAMPQPVSSQSRSPRPPRLRSFVDRCRQVALFELGGLLLITPPFAWLSGVPITESIALLAMLSLIAAMWNGSYNTSFDWVEGRLTGRSADRRPLRLRVVHAIGFEVGLFAMTWPVIVWWTGMGWMEAFVADIALALTYVIYAFAFNLGYDRLFPIAQFEGDEGCDTSAAAADPALVVAFDPTVGHRPDASLDLTLAAQPRPEHG